MNDNKRFVRIMAGLVVFTGELVTLNLPEQRCIDGIYQSRNKTG
jgi:hypothetical protein